MRKVNDRSVTSDSAVSALAWALGWWAVGSVAIPASGTAVAIPATDMVDSTPAMDTEVAITDTATGTVDMVAASDTRTTSKLCLWW